MGIFLAGWVLCSALLETGAHDHLLMISELISVLVLCGNNVERGRDKEQFIRDKREDARQLMYFFSSRKVALGQCDQRNRSVSESSRWRYA